MIEWRLKDILLEQNIRNSHELSKALRETLGISISQQTFSKLMSKQPAMIRLETAQYLCTFLNMPLSAFLEITPEIKVSSETIIQPFGNKPHPNDSIIISPEVFF